MKVTATSSGPGLDAIFKGISGLNGADVLVGIPEGDNRQDSLSSLAGAMKLTKSGKLSKKAAKYLEAAKSPISNAELLFIFTNGSPLHGQPPRVVIEAAIEAEPTKSLIAKYLAMAAISAMDGDQDGMVSNLKKAGTIGESASKRWFTDPRNGWPQNAPSTIKAKSGYSIMGPVGLVGMDAGLDAINTPGIDTGQMRRAIISVVEMGNAPGHNDSDAPEQDVETAMEDVGEAVETVGEGVEAVGEVVAL